MILDCFATVANPPQLVPGSPDRAWMDNVAGRTPYRCLPMTLANTTGWEILCPFGFTAEWNGNNAASDIKITGDVPGHEHLAISHFAFGILTFHVGYLFRTSPGWAVKMSGAPNHHKHGIQALEGLIETDWLPFPGTMNWRFTAPGRVRFEKDEPFCFITLTEHGRLDQVEPVIRSLDSDPDLKAQYAAWSTSRATFNQKIASGDPETLKQSWQRHYFQGKPPEDGGEAPEVHVNKRRLKCPVTGK